MKVLFVSSGKGDSPGPIVFSQGESLERAGIEIDYLLAGPGMGGYLAAIPRIRKAWKSGSYELVHAHYGLSAVAASLAGKFPLMVSLMGSDLFMPGLLKLPVRLFCRHRWKVTIVKSAEMRSRLKCGNVEVIPNGVDLSLFTPLPKEEARRLIGYPAGRRLILFGSSPARSEKNPELAREAFRLLNQRDADLQYLEGVPRSEVPWHLNAADVLLVTSRWEGSPNIVKEAMACNRPVVSTDAGDVKQLFGETEGYFIATDKADSVAGKLEEALAYGRETPGRERIIALGLDAESVAKRIVSLYEKITG